VKAPDSENTLTYVISSTADEKYLEVVVSDVRSPSRFSVQLDEWLEAIDNLQCDIKSVGFFFFHRLHAHSLFAVSC